MAWSVGMRGSHRCGLSGGGRSGIGLCANPVDLFFEFVDPMRVRSHRHDRCSDLTHHRRRCGRLGHQVLRGEDSSEGTRGASCVAHVHVDDAGALVSPRALFGKAVRVGRGHGTEPVRAPTKVQGWGSHDRPFPPGDWPRRWVPWRTGPMDWVSVIRYQGLPRAETTTTPAHTGERGRRGVTKPQGVGPM